MLYLNSVLTKMITGAGMIRENAKKRVSRALFAEGAVKAFIKG